MKRLLLSRRDVLFAGISAPLLSSAAAGVASWPTQTDHDIWAQRLTAVFSQRVSAEVVGSGYLVIKPAEARVADLVRLVVDRCGGVGRLSALDTEALRIELARTIQDDFVSGFTVRFEGWILSVTEARLMALAALTA